MSRNLRYQPLDALLARPTIRVLRSLRFHDWVSMTDLAGEGPTRPLWLALKKLAARGFVEIEAGPRNQRRYRITAAGRAELRSTLALGTVDIERDQRITGTHH